MQDQLCGHTILAIFEDFSHFYTIYNILRPQGALKFQVCGIRRLKRVVILSGALSVQRTGPIADTPRWSHGVHNSEVSLYFVSFDLQQSCAYSVASLGNLCTGCILRSMVHN